jgi:hypothetical protein
MTASLWQLMQADHDRIWDDLNALVGGPGGRIEDAREQRRVAKRLVRRASAHDMTEELVVWPVVRARCHDGKGLLAELLDQEGRFKRALNELAHVAGGNPEFDELCNTLAGEARTHLSYEQSQVWPRLDDALDEAELDKLARRWQLVARLASSRPHPHLHRPVAPLVEVVSRLHRVTHRSALPQEV